MHLQVDQGRSSCALQSKADRSAGNWNCDFHKNTASRGVSSMPITHEALHV